MFSTLEYELLATLAWLLLEYKLDDQSTALDQTEASQKLFQRMEPYSSRATRRWTFVALSDFSGLL